MFYIVSNAFRDPEKCFFRLYEFIRAFSFHYYTRISYLEKYRDSAIIDYYCI